MRHAEEYWVDITEVGSQWETQIDVNSRSSFRHRPQPIVYGVVCNDWTYCLPPD